MSSLPSRLSHAKARDGESSVVKCLAALTPDSGQLRRSGCPKELSLSPHAERETSITVGEEDRCGKAGPATVGAHAERHERKGTRRVTARLEAPALLRLVPRRPARR